MPTADLRRLCGLLGIAAVWAVLWIPLGWAAGIVDALARGRSLNGGSFPADIVPLASIGAVCGFLFGLVFSIAERRRAFETLTSARMAL